VLEDEGGDKDTFYTSKSVGLVRDLVDNIFSLRALTAKAVYLAVRFFVLVLAQGLFRFCFTGSFITVSVCSTLCM